jgi:hypothetical protein
MDPTRVIALWANRFKLTTEHRVIWKIYKDYSAMQSKSSKSRDPKKAKKTKPKRTVKVVSKSESVTEVFEQLYPRDLHKELWGHEKRRLEETLYRWWWEFLKAAEEHPTYQQGLIGDEHHGKSNYESISKTKELFGELGNNFMEWWLAGGSGKFGERGVPLINVLSPTDPSDIEFKEKNGVVCVVPMTISKELLREQFNIMLDIYHPEEELRRHKHSTAEIKIYPKQRYVDVNYRELVNFWRLQQSNLEQEKPAPMWRVLARMIDGSQPGSVSNLELQLEGSDNMLERNKISRQASTLYKKANELMQNALLGHFPNDESYQSLKHGNKSKR